jgi:hypothetical protein
MWNILLQLRVLLPYLARLAPLLERSLVKAAPDLSELIKPIAEIQTSSLALEAQAKNQALQLERMEQQLARLRVLHENGIEESRRFFASLQSLRRWTLALAIVTVVLLLVTAGMVAFLVTRP